MYSRSYQEQLKAIKEERDAHYKRYNKAESTGVQNDVQDLDAHFYNNLIKLNGHFYDTYSGKNYIEEIEALQLEFKKVVNRAKENGLDDSKEAQLAVCEGLLNQLLGEFSEGVTHCKRMCSELKDTFLDYKDSYNKKEDEDVENSEDNDDYLRPGF